MAKVLMFGWEFPPHISGGLGTACLGLTEALIKGGTDILFVVPKAFGDEPVPLLDASEVRIDAIKREDRWTSTEHHFKSLLTTIQVSANISPYGNLDPEKEIQGSGKIVDEPTIASGKEIKLVGGRCYAFKGGYGSDLHHEVYEYSKVAAQIADTYDFDLIHCHDWFTYPAGIEAKRVSGRPLVVQVHSTEFDRAGEYNVNPYVFEIEKRGMVEADKVIAVSNWTKALIISRYEIPAEKVVVVHNGILAQSPFGSTVQKLLSYVVTFLGRITYQKGPEYFVQAAKKVLQHFPDVHFVMAGSGDLLPAIVEEIARLRMGTHFHFTGFLQGSEVDDLWSVSDVYVMPSVSEPFGITPLEAMRAGVPVIVSNQSGVSEVLKNAVKIDFWDTDKLADAIINILNHKSLSDSMKQNGKKELHSHTWESAARKMADVYRQIID